MPHTNPSASFEVAVRHLFRHLDEADALLRNPLVSRLFESSRGTTTLPQRAAALAEVRRLVLVAARDFRDRAASDSEKTRRFRQYDIVHGHCVERKPLPTLAAELGISLRQCYRERAEIGRAIGSFIRSYEPERERHNFERLSEYQFQMERAAVRVDIGDFHGAMRTYEELAGAGDALRKMEMSCKMAELTLELGKYSAAAARLDELARMAASAAPEKTEAVRMQLEWLRARLALETADFQKAGQLMARARSSLLRLENGDGRPFRTLRLELAIESANQAIDRGEFALAQQELDAASRLCLNDPAADVKSLEIKHAQINLNVSRMRPGDGQSMREHMRLVNQTLDAAQASRSLKHRILATTMHVQLQSYGERAPQEVERVLALAKRFANPRFEAVISLMLADHMLHTGHWRVAGPLLRYSFPRGTFAFGLAMDRKGQYLQRLGDPFAAQKHHKLAFNAARHAGNDRLCASALRGLAVSAEHQGRQHEASDYIESAIPIAEQHGTLTGCMNVYRHAARITGKAKYARVAENLRLALRT